MQTLKMRNIALHSWTSQTQMLPPVYQIMLIYPY